MDYHQRMLENQTIFSKMVYRELAPYGVTSGQPKILEYLLHNDGCVQKEIAKACLIEPASVTTILAKMEKDGMLYRQNQNNNRRSLHVWLTEEGKQKALMVVDAFEKCEKLAFNGMKDEEQKLLMNLLERVNSNLKKEDSTR